ncbi:MAG TPA: EamA family transporter, partial [Longimicrobiaceae bacterium]|nr:EamA family transporter [Longimicrobiaceae bacterium]
MRADDAGTAPPLAKVLAAFAAVYVLWGSTYLAIRFAIETLPPFLMASARFLLAGAALYAFVRARGTPRPQRVHWRSAAVVGGLLLFVGNGGVVWAERTVPSGVVALLVAMVPLWMTLLEWLRPGGRRPGRRVVLGLAVGFAGMVLLVGPLEIGGAGGVDPAGAAVVLVATLAWAVGSIYSRSAQLPDDPLLATGMEMIAGGVLLAAAGLARGELGAWDPAAVSTASVLAFAYLVTFGSLVGFTAYVWLLRVSTPARVSTYAYVNPVVAVLLGWMIAGEPLNARILGAAAIIVVAVAAITGRGRRRAEAAPEAEPA